MRFIGVEVEQETSESPPKKKIPGSAPALRSPHRHSNESRSGKKPRSSNKMRIEIPDDCDSVLSPFLINR